MATSGETRNYLVNTLLNVAEYRERFPQLTFWQITSSIFILDVPPEGENDFIIFQKEIQSVFMPVLYGLNASTGVAESNITFFHNYPFGELRGKGVLIGFIDSGIDYTNPLFQFEDQTTRIVSIWDQSMEGEGSGGFNYGQIYSEDQINEALNASNPYEIVPSRDEVGHGTFLASVAAGYDRTGNNFYTGGAPDATLAIVKLRPAKMYLREYYLVEEKAVAYQDNDYLAGVDHLIKLAHRLRMPLAICTGIGCNEGGHDGSSVVERYLEEVASYEDLIIVLSAGNEANQGHHYTNQIKEGEVQVFEVNVSEKEKGFVLNIWMNKPDVATIAITTPLGQKVDKIPMAIGKAQIFRIPLEPTEISVTYRYVDMGTGDENIRIRLKDPTPGIWQFTLYGERIVDGEYNVWLPREAFILPNTRFLKPEAYTTVCIPSTAQSPIVVGAYNSVDKGIYAPSGRGPTRDLKIKPDFIAPGVNVQGAGPNNTFITSSGTSISAAITASASALLLQWAVLEGNMMNMNTRVAKTVFIRGANRNNKETYPNNITGYGELNLKSSIMQI